MVNYEKAIKKPFTDLTKLVVGTVLSLIPIVNLAVIGYAIESSGLGKTKDSKKLPEWKNWSHLFVQGLSAAIINIVYMIPAFLVIMVGVGLVIGDLASIVVDAMIASELSEIQPGYTLPYPTPSENQEMIRELIKGNWYLVLPSLIKAAPILIVGLLLSLTATFVSPVAVLHSVKKKKFGAAFDLTSVFKKACTTEYIITWIASILIGVIITAILSLIPLIGLALAMFIVWIIKYSLYGDAYREVK